MTERVELELDTEFIVLAIPAASVEVTVTAKVWMNGEIKTVARTMPFQEVLDAIREAQEAYIPVFTLTDLGRREPERLKERYAPDDT